MKAKVERERRWARGEGKEEWGLKTSPLSGALLSHWGFFLHFYFCPPPSFYSSPLSYFFLFIHLSELCWCQEKGSEKEERSNKSEINLKKKKSIQKFKWIPNIWKYAFSVNADQCDTALYSWVDFDLKGSESVK